MERVWELFQNAEFMGHFTAGQRLFCLVYDSLEDANYLNRILIVRNKLETEIKP